jgi:RNA polymerase subunit RPABC4/transcription elongation factor Spt4
MTIKEKIIKEWKKTKVVHPTKAEIARKLGITKQYAGYIINEYLNAKNNK